MTDNKMKFAQDILSEWTSGVAMGGFNARVLGHTCDDHYRHRDFKGAAGWSLADDMVRKGKLFYVHNFHTSDRCHAFPYGGTWVCNGCNRSRLDEPWWTIKVFKDGDAWCCIGEGFDDLQASDNYAFGSTRNEAISNYGEGPHVLQ